MTGDLVQERLELVVVVPVDHRHPDVVLGQLLRTGNPRRNPRRR